MHSKWAVLSDYVHMADAVCRHNVIRFVWSSSCWFTVSPEWFGSTIRETHVTVLPERR